MKYPNGIKSFRNIEIRISKFQSLRIKEKRDRELNTLFFPDGCSWEGEIVREKDYQWLPKTERHPNWPPTEWTQPMMPRQRNMAGLRHWISFILDPGGYESFQRLFNRKSKYPSANSYMVEHLYYLLRDLRPTCPELAHITMPQIGRDYTLNQTVDEYNRIRDEINRLAPPVPPAHAEEDVMEKLKLGSESKPPEPDGPFDSDGFSFSGVEVRFGRATRQYRLVLALWDGKINQPALPRLVNEVITELWGEGNETKDSTFRQLCTDTRRRFQTAHCPLNIQLRNGKVQLSRL
jgi:hypothetical protein